MEPHAPIESGTPPPQLSSPFLSSSFKQRSSIPSLNLDVPSSDSSQQGTPCDSETSSTTSQRPAAATGGSLYIEIPPSSGSKGSSPSRISSISARAGSQLQRVASVKHNRSSSSPMGFTGDKGQAAPQRGAAALFGLLFAAKQAEQHPPAASTLAGTPSLLPAQMTRPRSGSNLSTMSTSKSSSKGFFTTLGSAIQTQLSTASPPSTPSRRSPRSMHLHSPGLGSTLLVDEFAGISFRKLLSSYTLEPTGTPETPEDALKRTPEGRLEELSVTAADLLERVYEAYKFRTASLADMLDEQEVTKELLEESRARTSQYKIQLERLATEEQDARDEQNFRITVHERRIKQLEAQLQQEHSKREEAEEELQRRNAERKKRTSAASDSGFESDGDSMFSRDRASMVVSPVESFMDGGVDEHPSSRRDSLTPSTYTALSRAEAGRCEHCSHCSTYSRSLTPSSASIRNPTPLSQTWSPGNDESGEKTPTQTPVSSPPSATTTTSTKWGFGSLTRKAGAAVSGGSWMGGNVDEVRSENRVLRARVGELERVVNDCLEFVAGRGVAASFE